MKMIYNFEVVTKKSETGHWTVLTILAMFVKIIGNLTHSSKKFYLNIFLDLFICNLEQRDIFTALPETALLCFLCQLN